MAVMTAPLDRRRVRGLVRAIWRTGLVFAFGLLVSSAQAEAQTADNVLLVVNQASAQSIQIGDYYARKRMVPAAQVLRIAAPVAEQVSRADYQRTIEAPIASWFARTGAYDRILYIILTKGTPLRIAGSSGVNGT